MRCPRCESLRWLGGRGRLQSGEPRPRGANGCSSRSAERTCWRAGPPGPAVAAQYGLAVAGRRARGASRSPCTLRPASITCGSRRCAQAAPTDEEAEALGATREFAFRDRRADAWRHAFDGAWLLHFARSVDCSTQPPDAVVGHNVHDFMPAGRDGARIRSLMNEIQMLLHEHPVNLRRERARQLPVNGVVAVGLRRRARADIRQTHRQIASITGACAATIAGCARSGSALGGRRERDIAAVAGDMSRGDTLIALTQPPAERRRGVARGRRCGAAVACWRRHVRAGAIAKRRPAARAARRCASIVRRGCSSGAGPSDSSRWLE